MTDRPATDHIRYIVTDHLTLDDPVASIVMTFPTFVSWEELADVKTWFALRVSSWERAIKMREDIAKEIGDD